MFRDPQRGTVRDHSELVRRVKRALRAGGVRQVRFHDLRHTFGTRMAAAGVPMPTLQDWMGHRDFKTTLIYADYAPSGHEVGLVERAFSKNGPQLGPPSAEAERPTDPTKRENPALRGTSSDAPERIRTSTDHTVHKALNLARLPVPPQARGAASIAALESVGTGR